MKNLAGMVVSFVIILLMSCSYSAPMPSAYAAKKITYQQCPEGKVYFDPGEEAYVCVRPNKPTITIKLSAKEKSYFHRGEVVPQQVYHDELRYRYCSDGRVFYDPFEGAYFCRRSLGPVFRINLGYGESWGGGWNHNGFRGRRHHRW